MVARDDQRALPTGGLPKAPTLLACFLEALAKREARDRHQQASIQPTAEPSPAAPEPVPALGAQPDLSPK